MSALPSIQMVCWSQESRDLSSLRSSFPLAYPHLQRMTELHNQTINLLPEVPPGHHCERGLVKCPPWQKVNEDIGLDFPLEDLLGSEVARNGQVLRHLSNFLQEGQGEWSVTNSTKLTVTSTLEYTDVQTCLFSTFKHF